MVVSLTSFGLIEPDFAIYDIPKDRRLKRYNSIPITPKMNPYKPTTDARRIKMPRVRMLAPFNLGSKRPVMPVTAATMTIGALKILASTDACPKIKAPTMLMD
jgi:hypothetical protein